VTGRGTRLLRLALATALVVPAFAVPAGRPASVQASGGLLPDLSMAPLSDFRIETVNGRRLLRFTAMMINIGDGHFEVRGSRPNTSQPMTMSQVIYETTSRSSPVAQQFPTNAVARYSGDGHNHWHVQEMTRYDMWGASGTFRGAKIGLCFLDSDPWNTSLPGEVGSYYRGAMCSTNPSALSNRMGVSVGWGDEYEWYLAWQWVDITGVPGGTYTVRAKADPYGFFLEKNETNQCAWARVSFTTSSNAVSVQGRGGGCVNDIDGSPFAADIAWAFEQGLTTGCAPDLFCTDSPVTREQMASFLVRALRLPATTSDFFADDERSIHEADINRVAAAGITTGCGPRRYCPTVVVTREQMASFLVRGYRPPSTTSDFFTDDERSIHEANINRLAASGITSGCAPSRFCPSQRVTRGQMVAFIHRASS
jgi:hypothetical protein